MMQSFTERSVETNAKPRGSAHGLSDESLVEAAKRGHSMAFATLSERYRQQLFRAAHRITRSCEDAEDAVRHVKIRALLDAAQGQIRIVSVSALAERTGTKYSDAAFRR
jgi:DNA-directed RNA polymerase specialized sigma24 family protein